MHANFQTKLKDNGDWSRMPFIFQLGTDFKSYREVMEYITSPDHAQGWGTDFSTFLSEATPQYFQRPNTSDTRVGGNNAINCYWQYGYDDDIIHPLTSWTNPESKTLEGMGRVYAETIEKNQQVLWMTMGVPKFSGLADFYADAVDPEIASMVNSNDTSYMRKLGNLVGGGLKFAFTFPFLPIIFMQKVAGAVASAMNGYKITKYYDLDCNGTMLMYYRYVNSILCHLAVNMGLFPGGNGKETNGVVANQTYKDAMSQDSYGDPDPSAIPSIFRDGIDMFKILSERDRRANPGKKVPWIRDSAEYTAHADQPDETGMFDGVAARLTETITGADKFVGFRVEKSTDSSESLSNSTGESSIAQTLNSSISQVKDTKFSFQEGNLGLGGIAAPVEWAVDALGNFAKGVVDTIGLDSARGMMTGAGYIDIPEVWKSSNFSKSYSFNMQLRSPYGDPISIMQSIYIPLAMLLAAALPRTVGKNSYSAPFHIRAYCKGMFAIPLGIIDSISIRRGAAEHGWSTGQLPTCVDVSFTIRDLSPVMHMAMADGANFLDILGQNSSFQEYLLTLSGMGLQERTLAIKNIIRKAKISFRILRTTYMNPMYWATSLGSGTSLGNILGAVTPWTSLKNN